MNKYSFCILFLLSGSLCINAQTATDTIIQHQLDEVEVVQQKSRQFVTQFESKMIVDAQQIQQMPKFLGTSDPIRYLQSLPSVSTNNETTTGIHIQGSADYQSLIAINSVPVLYPNHLLGLFSTFNATHFKQITVQQAQHTGTMTNRVGGRIDFLTHKSVPERFSIEGNLGLISTDLTASIPIGKHNALYLSGRTSYINALYGKWLEIEGMEIKYNFQDYNATFLSELSQKDKLVLTAFYSRDKIGVNDTGVDVSVPWNNILASAEWSHRMSKGLWKTTAFYSSFDDEINVNILQQKAKLNSNFALTGLHNSFKYYISDSITLEAVLDYNHYICLPMQFDLRGIDLFETSHAPNQVEHSDELGLGVDLRHDVNNYFAYNVGIYASGYYNKTLFGGLDPRVTLHFYPASNHTLSLHYGMYSQNFHKVGLTNGGLPTDFFFFADRQLKPEKAHSFNIKYTTDFIERKYSISAELYFKQIYHITESVGSIFELLNKHFSYSDDIITGNGRNYGINLMLQRNYGYLTGYISYTYGRSVRQLPSLEGRQDYCYASSYEREHDLKVVLNSQIAKRWDLSAMFVFATGLPYTQAQEVYMLNGKMMCAYSTYNGAHMPNYHRLDLSCSYDIINKNGHLLGINLSLYNVYNQRNVQFVVYRENLSPVGGTFISRIIPSISIYGKF